MAATVDSQRARTVGERVELAKYTAAGRRRVLYGQRIDGIVRVTDRPAVGTRRCYLVERELHRKDELDALIADYLHQAHDLNDVPMSTSLLDRDLRAQAV
jgi:hypothetical protein